MYYINVYFSLKYTFNKIKFYKSVFFILKSIACGRYIRGENLKKSLGKTYSLFKLNNHSRLVSCETSKPSFSLVVCGGFIIQNFITDIPSFLKLLVSFPM